MEIFDDLLPIKVEPISEKKDRTNSLNFSTEDFLKFLEMNPEIKKKSFIIDKDMLPQEIDGGKLKRHFNDVSKKEIVARKKMKTQENCYEESIKKFQNKKTAIFSNLQNKDYDFGNRGFAEFTNSDAYSNYKPSKLKIGKPHPYVVIESRSLFSAEVPDVRYELKMPNKIIQKGLLSNVQLETVVYACQKHEEEFFDDKRYGFLIGDGAGVGKGRSIAGIILENYLAGRTKSVWISVSNDLKQDAERDLNDIGNPVKIHIPVLSINKMTYNGISSKENGSFNEGVLFVTYSSLISYSKRKDKKIFYKRFDQIIDWLKEDFDGLIIFDECHKAKNVQLKNKTKTGLTVNILQDRLKKARIVYASATGASEPKHMAYMVRLGLWGPGKRFTDFDEFEKTLTSLGVGAMELIAIEMKTKGVYLARQLSFQGVQFEINEITIENYKINGYKFKDVYNKCVHIWIDIYNEFQQAFKRNKFTIKDDNNFESQFWSAHQRFFKYLCIAGKIEECVKIAKREVVENHKCVVIGLQTTGEAQTIDLLDETGGDLFDFVSSAKGVIKNLIENHYPSAMNLLKSKEKQKSKQLLKSVDIKCMQTPKINYSQINNPFGIEENTNQIPDSPFLNLNDDILWSDYGNDIKIGTPSLQEISELDEQIQKKMLRMIEDIDSMLPLNALDQLIHALGGPDEVSEMTGRKGRMIEENGAISYQSRKEQDIGLENINLSEKDRFNRGEKLFAIISDAASIGISLHSDKRFDNKRQRLHITLELPWSADKAIQQFGRTHRSNQVNSPHYTFLISNLAGERRFAATVAKRLESLGALTHGDRRCADNKDFGQFNIDNEFGLKSVNSLIQIIKSKELPVVPFPKNFIEIYGNDHEIFRKNAKVFLDKLGLTNLKTVSVTKFLNRILGMEIDMQNALFQYFLDIIDYETNLAKSRNIFDQGIRDIMNANDNIYIEETIVFNELSENEDEIIKIHKVKNISKGMSWKVAMNMHRKDTRKYMFYISKNCESLLFALCEFKSDDEIVLITPNFPEKIINKATLDSMWTNCEAKDIKNDWEYLYNESKGKCIHVICNENCPVKFCTYGKRTRVNYLITGAVFSALKIIGTLIRKCLISRIELHDGCRLVGTLITPAYYRVVMTELEKAFTNRKCLTYSVPNFENSDDHENVSKQFNFDKISTDSKNEENSKDSSVNRTVNSITKKIQNERNFVNISRMNDIVNKLFKKPEKRFEVTGIPYTPKPLKIEKKEKISLQSEMLPNVTVQFYNEFKKKV